MDRVAFADQGILPRRITGHDQTPHRHQPAQSLQDPDAQIRAGRGVPPARRIPAGALAFREVQGHGKPILQYGKLNVALTKVEPAGQYALKLTFDDGHDSGLFTWDYLYQLAVRQEDLWNDYLAELKAAGKTRDPNESVVKLML